MAGLSWEVTGQVTGQTINDDAGNTIVGSYIYFVTGMGNKASVFVADTQTTTENVTKLIHAEAQLRDEIGALRYGRK